MLAKVFLAVAAPLVFFALAELLLALAGVAPSSWQRDPLVGFAGSAPLFVPVTAADGTRWWETSDAKLELFNPQRFPLVKDPDAFRIFCLGGSTTYGRPYDDATSFAGWLRLILPEVEPTRKWQVVNGGGFSYASYRVAALMEELVRHQPDLFIVYTGHNEFLEERTYASIRDLPKPVKALSSFVAKTRVATAMTGLLQRVDLLDDEESDDRFMLPEAVNAKLDQSAGLDLYERDDGLRKRVLEHYRASLERIVAIARSAGADLILVKPASNDRSCSPFKSEHTPGISAARAAQAEHLLEASRRSNRAGDSTEALRLLDEALLLDPRFAALHYECGRALFDLDRPAEAKAAFSRARDEDVCPLRAVSEMESILEAVARDTGTLLVDFPDLLERNLEITEGHTILGEEDFLDHVHPTIDGHRRLAVALAEAMSEMQILPATAKPSADSLARISSRVEAGIDRERHAEALASLAWTLDWAGKRDDSRRLALEAFASGFETPRILLIAGRHFALDGDPDRALELFQRAVRADPLSPTPHYQLGLLAIQRGELEAAAAHFALATILWPHDAKAHEKLGLVMAERGRYAIAVASLQEAKRRDPGRGSIDDLIERVQNHAGVASGPLAGPEARIDRYPSGVVRVATLSWPNPAAGSARPGLRTEWSDDGLLFRFADTVAGSAVGTGFLFQGLPGTAAIEEPPTR